MSININLKIQKKDLWLLSAIVVFLVGVGYVIAYDWATGSGTGLPSIHGHTANEIEGVVAGIEYDSGWFAITTSTTYTLNHGLSVEPPVVLLYIAQNPDGSGNRASGNGANDFGVDGSGDINYHSRGTTIASVNSSQIKIRTGSNSVALVRDVNGNAWSPGNAYARIIASTSLGGGGGSSGSGSGGWVADGTAFTGLSISNAAWYNLDLSSKVGSRETLVLLKVREVGGNRFLCAKPYSSSDIYGCSWDTYAVNEVYAPVANEYRLMITNTDSNGRVGLLSSTYTATWDIILVGYVGSGGGGSGVQMKTGKFTGNGASQYINVGFQPTNIVIQKSGNDRQWWTKETSTFTLGDDGGTYNNCIVSIDSTGFTVGTEGRCNNNGATIYYTATKE